MNSEAKRFEIASEIVFHGEAANTESTVVAQEIMGKNFFGPEQWLRHYGIWFSQSQLKNISGFPWDESILNSPCPFNRGKRIKETHYAFLGLDRFCNKPLDILRWHEMHPFTVSGKPKMSPFDAEQDFARLRTCWFKWHLLLIEAVPDSFGKTYKDQAAMLPENYRAPYAIEELTKNMLYYKKNNVYTGIGNWVRCQDVPVKESHSSIGEFNRARSCPDSKQHHKLGFSAYRKTPSNKVKR